MRWFFLMQAYDKLFSEIHLFCWNFEWLQNAVQAGMFDNFVDGNSDSPNARAGSRSKVVQAILEVVVPVALVARERIRERNNGEL